MSQEVVEGATLRLVRDADAGHYYIQVSVDGAHRTFASLKLGKLDQLREQAKAKATPPSQ